MFGLVSWGAVWLGKVWYGTFQRIITVLIGYWFLPVCWGLVGWAEVWFDPVCLQ
jgi:hypothetical protein